MGFMLDVTARFSDWSETQKIQGLWRKGREILRGK